MYLDFFSWTRAVLDSVGLSREAGDWGALLGHGPGSSSSSTFSSHRGIAREGRAGKLGGGGGGAAG